MDSTATNYNSAATSQTGVTCTYASGGGGGGGGGGGSTGGSVVTGGGGGGGGGSAPSITLAMLPHIGAQPLAYLYLSQIPYTGLDLGLVGTAFYWIALLAWSVVLAYFVLFSGVPFVRRSVRSFGAHVSEILNAQKLAEAAAAQGALAQEEHKAIKMPHLHAEEILAETPSTYSSYEGFKSFAREGALSIEDIVKSLSRERAAHAAHHVTEQAAHTKNVEPIYEHVEPIVGDIFDAEKVSAPSVSINRLADASAAATADIRGLASALLEGDRMAVFAGLRQYVRGGGAPEKLVSSLVFLFDDAYRARIDGPRCDPVIARVAARIDTPTLEKFIAALATAIDSSYTDGVTGAKLALTRALAILGA